MGLQILSKRLDSTQTELLVTVEVDPSYRKSIYKTLRKFSTSGHEMGLQILSNRLDSTRTERLVTVNVDLPYHIISIIAKILSNCCKCIL